MPDRFPETALRDDCPFCKSGTFADTALLSTENFLLAVDHFALTAGHLLLMPKRHISCIGTYPEKLFPEFSRLYKFAAGFVRETFGSVCTFEHGNTGQSVFHSHVHFLPCKCSPADIVPEGGNLLTPAKGIADLKNIFNQDGKYLFFSIDDKSWTVDSSLSEEGFFALRFAPVLGVPKRANWKEMVKDKKEMSAAGKDIAETIRLWRNFSLNNIIA